MATLIRRRVTRLLLGAGLALSLCACRAVERPPLLLLISVDTLRADRLGPYGAELEFAPHLEALLTRSVVFRAAFSTCSYTLPSVSSLMTGRYPEELGMLANASLLRSGPATLAEVLRLHGWRTGAVVSNYVLRRETGLDRGFEYYDARLPQQEANRDRPERIARETTDAALVMFDRLTAPGTPAFLWVHYQDPHGPYLPPQGWRERYLEIERGAPDGLRRLPAGSSQLGVGSIPAYQYVTDQQEAAFYRAGYHGEISYLDAQVGRLLEGIEARRRLGDAVLVFTADHGEGLGERDYWFAHGEYLTDPLVRIPLAIRVPGRSPRVRDDPASLVDLFPTLLPLFGIPSPGLPSGRDLFAEDAERAQPSLYLATLRGSSVPRYGLVTGGYKYLRTRRRSGPEEELYRLGQEERDLSAEQPERLRAMREELVRFRSRLDRSPESRQQLSPLERDRLRRLGYVED